MQPRRITIQTRVDEELFKTVQSICEIHNMTMSEYLRLALKNELANEKQMFKVLANKLNKTVKG